MWKKTFNETTQGSFVDKKIQSIFDLNKDDAFEGIPFVYPWIITGP
jgi:hypothetical protein